MERILHKITHTEIRYGILTLRKTDGTIDFFSNLPRTFTIILRKNKLFERSASQKQVWMGIEAMRKLNPNDVVIIYKKGKTVIIE